MNLVNLYYIVPVIVGVVVAVISGFFKEPSGKRGLIALSAVLVGFIICWCIIPEDTKNDSDYYFDPPSQISTPERTTSFTEAPSFPYPAWNPPDGSASPSKADIVSVQNNKSYPNNVTYPKTSSYLSQYEVMYVKSGKGDSIFLFTDPSLSTKRSHYVYEGNAVTVLARQKSASFIIYYNSDGYPIAGWVNSDYLVYNY